jgi:hypothetical protein
MSYYPVIQGPVAPYNNVAIEPQYFQPSRFPITAISYGTSTTFTLGNSTNNVAPNYVIGQLVRVTMPSKYGARQLNEKTGYVTAIPTANQVTVTINSTSVDPFIPSPTFTTFQQRTLPQMMAIGDINSGAINSNGNLNFGTYIPGSFENISPL